VKFVGLFVCHTSFCTPNSVQYTYDTYALAKSTANAVVKRGGDTWFFLTVDFAFGHALAQEAAEFVKAAGGRIVGETRHPLNSADFSSFLLHAQASGAKIIALANASSDMVNAIKAANEFRITGAGKNLAALAYNLNGNNALGLQVAQGLLLTESFYWDLNEETRPWLKRFLDRLARSQPVPKPGTTPRPSITSRPCRRPEPPTRKP
jgi:branched-chain amino acid transport system substrate-binding protein